MLPGPLALLCHAATHAALTGVDPQLLARRPTKVTSIVLANKIARVAWATMSRGDRYREPIALVA
jgi:transposase